MKYIAYKEVSIDGKHTRYYVISPAGDIVCSTHASLRPKRSRIFSTAVLLRLRVNHMARLVGLNEEQSAAA